MKRIKSCRYGLVATLAAMLMGVAQPAFTQGRPAALLGFKVSPTRVRAGRTVKLRIALTRPAPAGGLTVTVTNDGPKVLPIPRTIRIRAGVKNIGITLTARPVRGNTTINLSGSQGGITRKDKVTVTP